MKSKSSILQSALKFSASIATVLLFSGFISIAHAAAVSPAMVLHTPNQDFNIDAATLTNWRTIQPQTYISYSFKPTSAAEYFKTALTGITEPVSQDYPSKYNIAAIYQYLKTTEPQIDKTSVEPRYVETDGTVTDFDPGEEGVSLDVKKSLENISAALTNNQVEVTLAAATTQPLTKLGDLNNKGIDGLIASGTSDYSGSPYNRIYNIKAGVQKEKGVLLAPGEEFSFNKYLGPVDGQHGFLPELVIKSNETIPEFGGGLCQVSTTVFRAAINAGLPITDRRNHSYAVSYYSPQGTDATIYPGSADLKFINNTSAYVMVWASFPSKNKLEFDLYGTKDSRQVALDGPYSFDKKSDGSLKAVWYRSTTMPDGQVVKDTFNSTYLPPADFHHTTTAEPPPTTTPEATTPTSSATTTTTPPDPAHT